MIDDIRKLLQDFLAPELKNIQVQVTALEKTIDVRFGALTKSMDARFEAQEKSTKAGFDIQQASSKSDRDAILAEIKILAATVSANDLAQKRHA